MAEDSIIVVSDSEENASQGIYYPVKHEPSLKKKSLHKIGRRIRDPFNKRKVKEVKQEKNALEATLKDLISKLARMILTTDRGQCLIGSVGSFQINCTNTINHGSENGLETLQERSEKLIDSANKLVEELTTENIRRAKENDDMKTCLERSEMKLDELKDLVTQCMSTISQCDVGSSQALKDLRGFHEALLNNLPNEKVVSDGITEIKLGLIFEDEYDFLPYAAKVLVTRLVHLFGHRGLIPLCEALKMDITDDIIESGYDEENMPSDDDNLKLILDKDICTRIIVKWANKSLSNDSTALLNILQSYERQRFRQNNGDYCNMSGTREDIYAQTNDQDKDSTPCTSLRSLSKQGDNASSDTSLSIDENYYTYSPLEMDVLHLLKLVSVEGLEA